VKTLPDILHDRQIQLYKKIASYDAASLVRPAVCNPDGTPKQWAYQRRRGRPRRQWAHL